MRIRYKTYDPSAVWYEPFDAKLPRDKKLAVNTLIKQCYLYFGAEQFVRYDRIVITLIRASQPVVDIVVKPSNWVENRKKSRIQRAA